jgi:Leucine-rich repeat (LRR) protein
MAMKNGDEKELDKRIRGCQLMHARPELNLASLSLSFFPSDIFALPFLRTLNLRNNGLEYLPKNIDLLANLEILTVSNNDLRSLPSSIGNLRKLRKLHLQHNRIPIIPASIGMLIDLEEILVQFNRLQTLPPEIGELFMLQHLDASNNNISELPPEIDPVNLPRLSLVNLADNPNLIGLSWKLKCLQDVFPLGLSNDLRNSLVKRSLDVRRRVRMRLAGQDPNGPTPEQSMHTASEVTTSGNGSRVETVGGSVSVSTVAS